MGTVALKPYMHGYFISLKLYEAARVIANPFAYAEHREKMVRDKMEKMAETRIRTKKDAQVKVNKALAEKILKEAEREKKKVEKKKQKEAEKDEEDMDVDHDDGQTPKKNLLNDPRFKAVFEDPEYAIDVNSREYALLNPSSVAQMKGEKTAVEDEEEESDKLSSDGLGNSESDEDSGSDSSDAGGQSILLFGFITFVDHVVELSKFDPRERPGQKNPALIRGRVPKVNLVPMRADTRSRGMDKNATFGQRRKGASAPSGKEDDEVQMHLGEITWTPSAQKVAREDNLVKKKGKEMFGAGMEKGVIDQPELSEMERKGRTQRRKGVRSGSRNVFRSLK